MEKFQTELLAYFRNFGAYTFPLQIGDSQQQDFFSILNYYESLHLCVELPCACRYARWCERPALIHESLLFGYLLFCLYNVAAVLPS